MLRQGCPHCAISPTAASRRSLGRVSVPMWPCLSPNVADQPLSPATDRGLGEPLPHQLTNRTRVHLRAIKSLIAKPCDFAMLCGISVLFRTLSPSERQIAHALLTRPPLRKNEILPKLSIKFSSFDLHVLSTPPAFILSQDQTLMLKFKSWPDRFLANCVPVLLNR